MIPLPLRRLATAAFALSMTAGLGESPAHAAAVSHGRVQIHPLTVTGGPPGFTAMEPARTRVVFTNQLSALAATRNQNLMNGSGVAAGDVDGDGRCDLFFCGISGTQALYRNLGDWRFEDVTDAAGLRSPGWAGSGAVFGDLDGDADLDLLVSTLGVGVQYYRNAGGRFELVTEASGLASTAGSTTVVLGDVDGDRDLDAYVVNYGAESVLRSGGRAEIKRVNGQWVFTGPHAHRLRMVDGQVEEVGEVGYLYLNDGSGRFQVVPWNSEFFIGTDGKPKAPPTDYGLGAQMRDVNGDGAPDLYICNDFQMPDRLWLNDGRGRFREAGFPILRKFPFSSMGVDFGDLDRDGHLDFYVVEMAGRHHDRAMRQVSGVRPLPNFPGRFETRPQVVRNVLYRGNGDGTWSDITEYAGVAATDWSWQPVVLDVDLDGFEDLLVVNGMMFDTQDRDALARVQRLGRQSPEAARTNLLMYPGYASPNVAFRNRGSFQFDEVSAAWGFDSTRISHGVALADLDDDGDADVVVSCLNDGPLLYRNNGAAPRVEVRLRGQAPNTQGIGGRIEVEGGPVRLQQQEVVGGGRYLSGDDTFRTFATGSATSLTVRVRWRSGVVSVVPRVPVNSRVVVDETDPAHFGEAPPAPPAPAPWFVAEPAALTHQHREELFDDFERQPLLPRQLSSLGPGVAWVDLDGEPGEELVIGSGRGGAPGVYRFGADGQALPLACGWTAPDDLAGLTGWVTAEGRPALLVAATGYEAAVPGGAPGLFELTAGAGGVDVRPVGGLSGWNGSIGVVTAADVEGDGDLDLFVGNRVVPGAYPRAGASRLLRREGGGLVDEVAAAAWLERLGMVSGAIWTDLENDGFPELVVATEWGPIRVLRNTQGQLSPWDPTVSVEAAGAAERRLSEFTGAWQGVTAADFNGDGRLDLAVANWGWNTGYRASWEQPLRLYHGKLGGSEHTDLLEAYFPLEGNQEVPRRSLNALSQAIPSLAVRFPTHEAYSQASMAELLAALPVRPEQVAMTTLASTVFLNLPDRWQAVPLPWEAQLAPAFGVSVADVDGDGNEDLFLAQNFFATRIEWPRADAGRGLWLRGLGDGRFEVVPAKHSGVALFGEQRGSALGDGNGDGRPDLVVTQNGGRTALWRSQVGEPGFSLRFQVGSGNPAGYGVTVRAEGGGPRREVRASTGYWSKDAPLVTWRGPRPSAVVVRWPGGREERVTMVGQSRSWIVRPAVSSTSD